MTPSELVDCPFCPGKVVNDGRMAGQTVMCPHCRNPIQMPAATTDFFTELGATRRQSVKVIRKKPSQNGGMIFAIVGGVLFLLVGVAIVITITINGADNAQNAKQTANDPNDPWNAGFDHGYHTAWLQRASEGASGEEKKYDDDYHGPFRYDAPEKMGRFRDGYRAGFKKGWNEK